MLTWNKKLYWMKDTGATSQYGRRQVYQIFGAYKCYIREITERKFIQADRVTINQTYFEIIAPKLNYQINYDQLYDPIGDKYYVIKMIKPYSTFIIKNNVRLICDENAKYGEA